MRPEFAEDEEALMINQTVAAKSAAPKRETCMKEVRAIMDSPVIIKTLLTLTLSPHYAGCAIISARPRS